VKQKSYYQFSKTVWWKTKTSTITKYILCNRLGEKCLKIIPKLIGSKKLSGICPTLLTLREFNSRWLMLSYVSKNTPGT